MSECFNLSCLWAKFEPINDDGFFEATADLARSLCSTDQKFKFLLKKYDEYGGAK